MNIAFVAWITATLASMSVLLAACNSSIDERKVVSTSDPRIACSLVEGPRSSSSSLKAIEHAKDAWAATFEKSPHSDLYSPTNMARFEPYWATLKDGVWHVEGTIPPGYHGYAPKTSVCRNDEGVSTEWLSVP